MKLKLSTIIESKEAIQRLAAERFPANIAYRIQRNIQALQVEALACEKVRQDLIKNKYGEPIDPEKAPDQFAVTKPEMIKAFTEEFQKLQEEEVEVQIMTIKLEVLNEMMPADVMALEFMIDVSSETSPEPPVKSKQPRHRK